MAILSDVKCGKCDRYYSNVRAHCPFCGARRGTQNKHAKDTDNMRGKMIILISLLAVLVIAVAVLLTMNMDGDPLPIDTSPDVSSSPHIPDQSTNTEVPGVIIPSPSPSEEPSPSPSPTPTSPPVQSVQILYAGAAIANNDFTEKVGVSLKLTLKIVPSDTEEVPVWTSSDTSVFDAVPTDTTGKAATITITGRGSATLTVTCGDVTTTCVVRGKT